MKTAVTGGTGFIGAMLVDHLLRQGDTVALFCRSPSDRQLPDHPNLFVHEGDLSDPEVNLGAFVEDVDVLFHCAGEIRDKGRMHALHVAGTSRLVKAAAGKVGVWVQLSSVGAYGPHNSGLVTEDTPTAPVGVYEVTKTRSDEVVLEAAMEGAFQARILRPANVIGRTMTNQSLAQFIGAIDRGRFVFIGPVGATTNYVAVDNLVEALVCCAQSQPVLEDVFNLADTCSLEKFVAAVCHGLDREVTHLRVPLALALSGARLFQWVPGFPLTSSRVRALSNRTSYHSNRLHYTLGYRPVVAIEEYATDLAVIWKRDHGRA